MIVSINYRPVLSHHKVTEVHCRIITLVQVDRIRCFRNESDTFWIRDGLKPIPNDWHQDVLTQGSIPQFCSNVLQAFYSSDNFTNMAETVSAKKVFDLTNIWRNDYQALRWTIYGVAVNIYVRFAITSQAYNDRRGKCHVSLAVAVNDHRRMRFVLEVAGFPEQRKCTEFVKVDNYARVKEYATFRYSGHQHMLVLNVTMESESVVFHLHHEKLKSFYKLSKELGDVLLTPIQHNNDNDGKEEEKEADLTDDVSNMELGIRMSSLLLRSSSEVFSKMLSNPMMEQQQKTIEIATGSVKVIDDFVYFLTVGSLRDTCNAFALLELSHLYRIASLNYVCLGRLCDTVKSCTLFQTVSAFDRWSYDDETAMDLYKKLVDKVKGDREALMKDIAEEIKMPKWWRALIEC